MAEICGITVSKVIVKWFTGHELALALGLQVAMARLGTAAALFFSPRIAAAWGGISYPVFFGALALCIGLLAYLVYCVMDRRLDQSIAAAQGEEEEGFKLSDIKFVVTNKGFWLIALLCLMFYAGVFPFLKFAAQLMIYKYGVDPVMAGDIPAILPFGTILLTPLFGSLYDRIGKGATLMVVGAMMLVAVHVLFALPILNEWWFALIVMVLLGIAFSLVPSAMWPSVPKIIPQKQLGTAYALIFYVQNIGLMCVPMLIGWVIDRYAKFTLPDGNVSYDFTAPMWIFALFGIVAVALAFMLKAEDRAENTAEERCADATGDEDTPDCHLFEPPHEPADQRDDQSLAKITEHDAEQQCIGDGDKGGRVDFIIARQAVHIDEELEKSDGTVVLEFDRRDMLRMIGRLFDGVFNAGNGIERLPEGSLTLRGNPADQQDGLIAVAHRIAADSEEIVELLQPGMYPSADGRLRFPEGLELCLYVRHLPKCLGTGFLQFLDDLFGSAVGVGQPHPFEIEA